MAWFRAPGNPGGSLKVRTASGRIATFEMNMADVLREVKCEINASQDLHGYDHPWAGGAGKNKFDFEGWLKSLNATYTKNGNSYALNTEANNRLFSEPFIFSDTNIALALKSTITIPEGSTATTVGFELLNTNNYNVFDGRKSEGTGNACKIRLNWSAEGDVIITEPMVVFSNTIPTSFEPYENVCPIEGFTESNITRCGANLFDGSKVTTTHPSNWSVTFENDNLTIVHNTAYVSGAPTFNLDLPNGNYVISYTATQLYKVFLYVNGVYNKLLNNGTTFTIENGNTYSVTFTAEDNSTNVISNIQIELGNTASEYHAYNSTPYLVQFGQTVYGGVLDVTRGKLHVTWGKKPFAELVNVSGWDRTETGIFYIYPLSNAFSNFKSPFTDNPKSTHFEYQTSGTLLDGCFRCSDALYFVKDDEPDIASMKTWFTNTDGFFTYELETPFDIDLTPVQVEQLLGKNNVWHDANGDTEVKYLEVVRN